MALDAPLRTVPLTLYTEQFIVRGAVQTREHRVTDILNEADGPFLVLEDVTLEDVASGDPPTRVAFARVSLASVLFAVSLQAVETIRELRTPKISEPAIVSIPPFRVVGNVHMFPDRSLRDALGGSQSPFVPVTDAVFWSDRPGLGRRHAVMVAVNQARAQIMAPYPETDPADHLGRGGTTPAPTRLPGPPGDRDLPDPGSDGGRG
jgi:hypothetical protein